MGGEVVGINTDTLDDNQDGIKEAKDILKSQGVSYKNLTFASDSTVGKYAGNIIAFPPTVLVDKSGNIISEPFMGGIDDQANYEQLMSGNDRQKPKKCRHTNSFLNALNHL